MDFKDNLQKYAKVRTLSLAFPVSIFDNVPTPELEAYLVGQVARAAVVFNVCEIVLFQEETDHPNAEQRVDRLVKLFEYAECPQYLRKSIFALDPDLKYAGLIHPLEAQHHLRKSQLDCPYREGVTMGHLQKEIKGGQMADYTEVNVGLNQRMIVPGTLDLNVRVTLKVDPNDLKKIQSMLGAGRPDRPEAMIVPPVEPMEKLNLFWGYYVRRAESLSQAIQDNIFRPEKKKFYDLVIGTSERGDCIDDVVFQRSSQSEGDGPPSKKHKSGYKHVLVVFGGVQGLEHSASCDKGLKDGLDVSKLFDYYVNTCPNQGSMTIRTEEAILISLSALRPKLTAGG